MFFFLRWPDQTALAFKFFAVDRYKMVKIGENGDQRNDNTLKI